MRFVLATMVATMVALVAAVPASAEYDLTMDEAKAAAQAYANPIAYRKFTAAFGAQNVGWYAQGSSVQYFTRTGNSSARVAGTTYGSQMAPGGCYPGAGIGYKVDWNVTVTEQYFTEYKTYTLNSMSGLIRIAC